VIVTIYTLRTYPRSYRVCVVTNPRTPDAPRQNSGVASDSIDSYQGDRDNMAFNRLQCATVAQDQTLYSLSITIPYRT
jgi:hypothetical protein